MFLGIEIGGTKLQLGLGKGDGTIVALWRGSVNVEAAAEGIRHQLQQALPELPAKANVDRSQLRGIGIGFGGPVDDATRSVIKSHQIAGWDDFPLAQWAEEQFGVPTVLGNDADVAGLAEALFGAGKGLSPIFYITIGSGIGGGLIINREIYRGCGRGAAEIGHVRVPVESASGYTRMILEEVASGWGIETEGRTVVSVYGDDGTQELLRLSNGKVSELTARHVGEAARAGDPLAIQILSPALNALAEGICQIIALLCPRRIVIGGGVSLVGEKVLFQPLRELVAQRVFRPFANCYDIVPAALGEEVVVHGALALAARKVG